MDAAQEWFSSDQAPISCLDVLHGAWHFIHSTNKLLVDSNDKVLIRIDVLLILSGKPNVIIMYSSSYQIASSAQSGM
jgi:hypothetical protein